MTEAVYDKLKLKVLLLRYPTVSKNNPSRCDHDLVARSKSGFPHRWVCSRPAGHDGPHVGYNGHTGTEMAIIEYTTK